MTPTETSVAACRYDTDARTLLVERMFSSGALRAGARRFVRLAVLAESVE
jgi:hypothetical protein